ncbi:hypothetical protein CLPU_3c02780 [Gottschalkia purinilytica]|uniref:Uncharacterized protein n=1 Tax=Gottschalkia purinilytica TaxID=1503 RepID=A0A0L0WDE7_GOTPU|nr:hypothetical protein [Gottschalkia purinilytica]KNF09498.1 hypothetical protein CLPU_3c02780 [Gottschalkia purinilytica]
MSNENNKDIDKVLEQLKQKVNPSEEQLDQLKELANKYSDKSEDEIFFEIIKLNKKLSEEMGKDELENKLKKLESIRPMLSPDQNKKLDKLVEAIKQSL